MGLRQTACQSGHFNECDELRKTPLQNHSWLKAKLALSGIAVTFRFVQPISIDSAVEDRWGSYPKIKCSLMVCERKPDGKIGRLIESLASKLRRPSGRGQSEGLTI